MVMRVAITDRPPMMDGHYLIKQRTEAQRIQEFKEFRSSSLRFGESTNDSSDRYLTHGEAHARRVCLH